MRNSSGDSLKTALYCAAAAEAKKANSIVVLDVKQVTLLADYFVFTGGESKAQVKAIAESARETLGKQGEKTKSLEGMSEARWVLLDFGDVIVHVLQSQEREYYRLEQFWNHALLVDWEKECDRLEIKVD